MAGRIALVMALVAAGVTAQRALDLRPSPREQKEALQEFRKLYKSRLPSVRSMGVQKLKDMDFPWRIDELLGVVQREAASRKEEDYIVVQAAIEVLGNTRDVEAVRKLMQAIVKERSTEIRTALMDSLGGIRLADSEEQELPWDEVDAIIFASLESQESNDIIGALDCLASLRRTDTFDRVKPLLNHVDWRVRSAAVNAVFQMFDKRSPQGIGELVEMIDREKGKLRTEVRDALTNMTGWDCGYDYDCWRQKFIAFDSGKGELAHGTSEDGVPLTSSEFFGVEISSERVLLVVDLSSSMLERYVGERYTQVVSPSDFKDNPRGFAGVGELSKWDVAREELIAAIKKLREEQHFNIYFFNDDTIKWRTNLVPATEKNKQKAIKKLDGITISKKAMTNFYGVLEDAFRLAGAGVKREQGAVGIDTIIFFTDGMPTVGEISLTTPVLDADGNKIMIDGEPKRIAVDVCYRRIADTIKRLNRFNKVTIHTIGIGQHAGMLLRRLARESGGKYRIAEEVIAERAKRSKAREIDR